MTPKQQQKVSALIQKGVHIPNPAGVEIGDEVAPDNISGDRVVIHTGCKIYGASTLILGGAQLGREAPVTIENCQIGPAVELKGGYFREAVFLSGASMGSCAHVREATLVEEHASAAHAVGLKQTILFPYVTLGSLINFCDCLMSGGTGRKNHSEVGSSYIHFNFTPNQDKATASLLGDVANGVMLNQPPIFLGGQGGLVGPCRLAFGITIAAGTIQRKDELRSGRLIFGGAAKGGNIPFIPGQYQSTRRLLLNNIIYIANLWALRQWYLQVRALFVSPEFPQPLLSGAMEKLQSGIDERIRRLGELCRRETGAGSGESGSSTADRKQELGLQWPALEDYLRNPMDASKEGTEKDTFLAIIHKRIDTDGSKYLDVIHRLTSEEARSGSRWLQGIVDGITARSLDILSLPMEGRTERE